MAERSEADHREQERDRLSRPSRRTTRRCGSPTSRWRGERLGWEPKVDVRDALRLTVEWFRDSGAKALRGRTRCEGRLSAEAMVIIPTYNELDNIREMVPRLLALRPNDRGPGRGRQLARRDGRVGRGDGPDDPARALSAPAREDGARVAPIAAASAGRSRTGRRPDLRDGRRLLPRSERDPALPRGDRATPTSCSAAGT